MSLYDEYYIVVFDESNKIKNLKAQVTKAACQINSTYKWELSATPIRNTPMELYSLMKVLDLAQFLFGRYYNYLQTYSITNFVPFLNRDVIVGYKNLDELKYKIAPLVVKHSKEDKEVVEQIGKSFEYMTKIINIQLTQSQLSVHNKLSEEIKRIVDEVKIAYGVDIESENFEVKPELVEYREKVLALYTLDRLVSNSVQCYRASSSKLKESLNLPISPEYHKSNKINEIVRIINDDVEENEKVVIYTTFKEFAGEIHRELTAQDYNCEIATGDNDAQAAFERFKSSNSAKVLVFTGVGKYGINLQEASHLIIADIPFTPSEVQQLIGRIVRIGQRSIPVVHYLVCSETVEKKIYNKLAEKNMVSKMVFGV